MGTTPNRSLRYPPNNANPNIPQDIQNLAADVDSAFAVPGFICTSGTRPSSPATGTMIQETDTKARGYWDNGSSRWVMFDTQWQTYTPNVATTSSANTWTQGNGVAIGRYFREGRRISVEVEIALGSTSLYGAGATGIILVTPPTGYYPASWVSSTSITLPMPSSAFVTNGGTAFGFVAVTNSSTPNQRWFEFFNPSGIQLTGAAGSAGSWNLWQANQLLLFSCVYETAFEA